MVTDHVTVHSQIITSWHNIYSSDGRELLEICTFYDYYCHHVFPIESYILIFANNQFTINLNDRFYEHIINWSYVLNIYLVNSKAFWKYPRKLWNEFTVFYNSMNLQPTLELHCRIIVIFVCVNIMVYLDKKC